MAGGTELTADELMWLARIERSGDLPPSAIAQRLRDAGFVHSTVRGPRVTPQGAAALSEARRRGVEV